MFVYLLLLFTVLPALELIVLIEVGSRIGSVNAILLIILTGVTGAYLARLQGFLILRRIQDNLDRGLMPTEEMMDGLMVLVGGILLLTPGFITDALGLFLLIPLTRSFIKTLIRHKIESMLRNGQVVRFTRHSDPRNEGYDDIDLS